MKWIEYESPPGVKLEKWMRTLGVDSNGDIFAPAAIAGDEQKVVLCASYDGTRVAMNHNHVYVPATWLAKEFPDCSELCSVITERARDTLSQE